MVNDPFDLFEEDEVDDGSDSEKAVLSNSEPAEKDYTGKKKFIIRLSGTLFALFLLVIVIADLSFDRKKKKSVDKNDRLNSLEEILKKKKDYSASYIRNRDPRKKNVEDPKSESGKTHIENRIGVKKSSFMGKNALEDKRIIEKYKAIDPLAAADLPSPGNPTFGYSSPVNPSVRDMVRPSRPGGTGKRGGVVVLGKKEDLSKEISLKRNQSINVRLKFSIRSTAGNSVIAVATSDKGEIRKGTIFYGHASFSNKRTYVTFSKARSENREFILKGLAVSGRDPGIPSHVSEIEGNATKSLKSGIIGAAGKVADKVLSNATGGVAGGVITEPVADLRGQEEATKKTVEYRVPAGTTFYVYIE